MLDNKKAPCYGCERRKPLCHSTCEDYITYTQEKANGAEQIRAKKAEEAIECYDWLKDRVNEYPDLEISDARKFVTKISDKCDESKENTLADYGVELDTYLEYKELKKDCEGEDADGDGETDDGTLRASIFAMIDSLPINSNQKDALAMISYGIKSVKRYAPWH